MSSNPDPDKEPNRIWTVLIYMAGDNNLSEECVYALTEAKEGLTDENDKLAVLAQFDPTGVRTETRRYLLRSRDKRLNEDADLIGWKARETDTGEPLNLLEFIRWGISQFPAQYYMVVLVGHGGDIDSDFLLRDENPPNSLNILELRYIFEQLAADQRMIHILGMDTCLMNMAEVCFELNRASVKYMVASEGFAPNTGWPYKEILKALRDQIRTYPDRATPEWLGKRIVEDYNKFYEPYINGGIAVDQSILEVNKIDEVKERMFKLSGALLDEIRYGELNYGKPKNNALVLAHWEAQSYNGEQFVDLHDFCDRLIVRYSQAGGAKSAVVKFCKEVSTAIDDLSTKTCVAGAAFQFSYGISIYFPWAILSQRYGNLAFPKETRWLDFLRQYHLKTRRPSRRRDGEPKFDETAMPFRAAVPQTRGRNGRVESMRNPPIREFVECPVYRAASVGELELEVNGSRSKDKSSTNGSKTTKVVQAARATAGVSSRRVVKKSNRKK